MTADARLSQEEMIGLGVAVAAHMLLAIALVLQVRFASEPIAPPERIAVSLATDISLKSTAPDPSENPAAAFAPEIAEVPEPELVEAAQPVEAPAARPQPAAPQPARPAERAPTPRATNRPTPAPKPSVAPSPRRATGSRIGDDFLRGASDGDGARGSPAAEFGPRQQAALEQAIVRQLKPHWRRPSGVDAEKLVSVIAWELNRDGSLRGSPRLLEQRGVTLSNQPQARIHAENAIRAVRLAAPFNLPEQYYSRWDELVWDFRPEL